MQIDCIDEKITAAYAYGNAEDAVDKLINIKLDGYLLVNINCLKPLVNALLVSMSSHH
ncbi:hypothetical protein [Weissella cibaria]|uniref:hypothetical protein n=1 Tax=Weissella cibaria TaxID=137591 RepID=UPI002B4B9731|nr:hypothetical protein [Weissella confusa]